MNKILRSLALISVIISSAEIAAVTDVLCTPQPERVAHNNAHMAIPAYFHKPLELSRTGLTFFLEKVYNDSRYPQKFLALNFVHVLSGVKLAHQSKEPRRFIQRLLSLFGQKMDHIYVNPYAFTDLITHLIPAVEPWSTTTERASSVDAIKERISSCLVHSFKELRQNPDAILSKLSEDIYELVIAESSDASARELQHALHYFLARGLGHLIWSPHDALETWHSFKTLGSLLEKCHDLSLLDSDMVNDLYWILIKQYCYFLSLASAALGQEFYDAVSHDLQECPMALWMHEELEECMMPKREYLRSQLIDAAMTSRMSSLGHIVY